MKIERKEIVLLSSIFFFFCSIFLLIPITGDDWYNYVVGKEGVISSIQHSISMYFSWEGRIVSRILIYLLTPHRIIYSIITSFLITLLCYFIANFYQTKYKFFIYFVTVFFLLTLENTMWTQSFLWVAGSVTYLFPCVLLIGYFYFYFHYIRNRKKFFWYHYFISSLFSFFVTMFVENLAFAYVLFHLFLFCYHYYKTKEIDLYLVFNGLSGFLGAFLMLISPGSQARALVDDINFHQLSLIGKIKFNIPNFLHYTFLCNIPFLILVFILTLLLCQKLEKFKFFITFLVRIFFLFLISTLLLHQMNISNILWDFLFLHLYLLVFVIGIFVLFLFYLFLKNFSFSKLTFFFFSIIIGLSSNFIMFLSPVWGGRVALFTTIVLFFSFLYFLFMMIEERKIRFSTFIVPVCFVFLFSFMLFTLFQYYQVYRFTVLREKCIKNQLEKNSSYITIYTMPKLLLWGNDPYDDFHIEYFKKYYHISDDKKIIYQTLWY